MTDVPMGTIDAERLGCSMRARVVFAEHAKGRTVPEIADDLNMSEDAVRGEIAGVWHDDAAKGAAHRKTSREEGSDGV